MQLTCNANGQLFLPAGSYEQIFVRVVGWGPGLDPGAATWEVAYSGTQLTDTVSAPTSGWLPVSDVVQEGSEYHLFPYTDPNLAAGSYGMWVRGGDGTLAAIRWVGQLVLR